MASSKFYLFKETKDRLRQPYYLYTYLEASKEFVPQVSSRYSRWCYPGGRIQGGLFCYSICDLYPLEDVIVYL